jgi:type I restriction enzyme S subunit
MNSEWIFKTFEEAPFDIIDGDRGNNYPKQSDFYKQGYCLFINTKNVTDKGFNFNECKFITKEKDLSLRKGKLQREDIILTTRGTIGNIAYYNNKIPFENIRINSGMLILRANKEFLFPHYLYLFLKSNLFITQIRALTSGTAQPQLPIRDIKYVEIPLPPLSEQKAIAHILSSLDDKIELNRQMNETLEAMARAIFKSWFVDFDPVRAKMEGRQPAGMDTATADLFPDEFEESSLGLIPKGWRVGKLGDYVEAVKGLSYKGKGLSDSGIPLHNLNSVYEGGSYKYEGIKYYVGEYKDRHIVYPGDVIVTNTEQGFKFLLIGYPAIVPKHYGSFGIFSHHIFRVRPLPDSPLTSNFIYLLLISPHFRDQVIGYTNGTTVNMLSADGLKSPLLAVPPHEIVEKFDKIVSFLLEKKEQNYEESQSLIEVRDTLLPKLMSGEIRVKEAEKIMEKLT